MFSLTALLASLPPASLVETDLPRFVAVALGRRMKAELPGLRALLAEETLRGYPPSLGVMLLGLVEEVIARGIEPATLDPRLCDRLLGSASFIATLESRLPLAFRRQRLRPGTVVTPAVRQTLGERLVTVAGVGPEVVLIAPVDLAHVTDARYTMPLGIVLGKPAGTDEAEALRSSWGTIEEAFGLQGPEAERWLARFLAVARRENHDAAAARAGLSSLLPEARIQLWDTVVSHLRDQELPEQHRPGRRGLERRLALLGLELDLPWVGAVVTLVEAAYRGAGPAGECAEGRPPCGREDLELWSRWVDVPSAARDRLTAMEPSEIERYLVVLSEVEAGRVDAALDDALRRALMSLRDQVLRPRWMRSRWALAGRDPLLVAVRRLELGEDAGTIRRDLEALADDARRAREKAGTVPVKLPLAAAPTPPQPISPAAAGTVVPTESVVIAASEAPLRPKFELPPMPVPPPPRPRPRTRPRDDFPAMPKAPAQPMPAPRPPRPATEPRLAKARPPTSPPSGPTSAPAASTPRSRTATAPHLVTPGQGQAFYDESFRELELIERDLVMRGPFPSATDRVDAIAREAAHLHQALGPSARSGDREFMAALARIEKVQAYLERLRPLVRGEARGDGSSTHAHEEGIDAPRGFLKRLFSRRDK